MPNWCTNTVTAVGDPDSINAAVTALSSVDSDDTHFDLRAAIPCPDRDTEGVDWNKWAVTCWGTKWNTDCPEPATIRARDDGTIEARWQFLSASAPPDAAFRALARRIDLALQWTLTYAEPGMAAYGSMLGDGHELHTNRPFMTIQVRNGEWVTETTDGTRGFAALDGQIPLVTDAMATYGPSPAVWTPNAEDGAHLPGELWTPQPGYGDQGGQPGQGGCFFTATVAAQLEVVIAVGITELISYWWNQYDWEPGLVPDWTSDPIAALCAAAADRQPGVDARTAAELVVVAAATWSGNPDCTRDAHHAFNIAEAGIPEARRSDALRLASALVGKTDVDFVRAAHLIVDLVALQPPTPARRPITLAPPVATRPRHLQR